MAPLSSDQQQRLFDLLESTSRVIGLRVCFHDRTGRLTIDSPWRTHDHPFCRATRNAAEDQCIQFDMLDTHVQLIGQPQGRIQTCHAGVTEIAVPVTFEGRHGGVLFAGPAWLSPEPSPAGVTVVPNKQWLEDRRVMLQTLAIHIAQLLHGAEHYVPKDRRQEINTFLSEHLDLPITLGDLAGVLNLSPSRTSHLVRELFGVNLTQQVRTLKMRQAAILLTSTGLQIKTVARQVGFNDPNYFARQFTREHGISPLQYRKRHTSGS